MTDSYRYYEMLDKAEQACENSGQVIYLYYEKGAESYNFTPSYDLVESREIVDLEVLTPGRPA